MRPATLAALALSATIAATAACNKPRNADAAEGATRDGSSVTTDAASVVKSLKLGRTLDENGAIKDGSDSFTPNETVYAVVETGEHASGTLVARWTFQDGQLVDETSQPIATGAAAHTEFHIAKPTGLPVGKYRVDISLNGRPVESEEFEVKVK
jgi:hypothetical protein